MTDYQVVTVSNSDLRRWGRQALTGNWGLAILATLFYMILSSAPMLLFRGLFDLENLDRISDLYTFLVSGPLSLGYIGFIIGMFRRQNPSPASVLHGFERFFKAFALFVVTSLLIALWTLLLIIPGLIAAYRYAMVFYILADKPDMGIFEIIGESKRMMAGNKLKFFLLQFSFIGWAILSFITLGLGFIFLLPYLIAASVGFYEVARGSLRQNYTQLPINETQKDPFAEKKDEFTGMPKEDEDVEL